MRTHLAHTAITLLFLFSSTHAIPSDPSATVPTTDTATPTVSANARINGTVHRVQVAEKLAVVSSHSTIPAASLTTTAAPTATNGTASRKEIVLLPPDDDLYTINYQKSDFKGSSYCSTRYKSFWYNDWTTDPTKRKASCDAVAVNYPNEFMNDGYNEMENGDIFWGPHKDGTNVCYWHFTCDHYEEVVGDYWASGPQISYKNVQNIAKAWYDPANWPKGKSPKACGHIWLDRKNSLNQCRITISIIADGTGLLVFA